MTITSEFGEVWRITCTVGDQLAVRTVSEGEIKPLGPEDQLEGRVYAYPDNCPRGPYYDPEKTLGCLSCIQAMVDHGDVLVWPMATASA